MSYVEYNGLDLLIAVKNKNIHDDLIREKTILFYWGFFSRFSLQK
jgi:hypothetical protein